MAFVQPKRSLALAAALALLSSGCATTIGHAPGPRVMGPANQGGSWDVVLPGPAVGAEQAGWEYSRRDLALAPEPESDLPSDAWPQPYRPDLSETRRLFLNQSSNEVLYLQQYPSGYPSYWRGPVRPYPWW